jgi:hypothetical protein
MTWLFAACWLTAIIALAFGNESAFAVLFAAGFILGVWGEDRDQQRRHARNETHRRYMREVRRHR